METTQEEQGTLYSQSGSSLHYSSDINATSIELTDSIDVQSMKGLKYLPNWPAVNLEFSGLTFEVINGENGVV